MTRPRLSLLALTLLFVALPASGTIEYRVSLAQPEQHLFRVTMTVPDVENQLVVALPAWNAFYRIRDFAHQVQDVKARAHGGQAVQVTKVDKQTWRIATSFGGRLGSVRIEYAVFWNEPGPFNSQLNSNHAFLNLAMVLFYVPQRRAEDVRVEFGDVPQSWKIAVALKPAPSTHGTGPGRDFWTFLAANYDALVDAPVEIGTWEESRFEVSGARIRIVVHGRDWDSPALLDTVRRVVAYQVTLMREVPFAEFLFIYHFRPDSGGGMEHANSTAIDSTGTPAAGVFTAHEFFHLWNVKRIRPRTLEPASTCAEACEAGPGVDHSRENWTRALWFAEGVTSTYGAYTLVRTGLWTPQQFYADLASEIGELESRPARRWQSAEQASLDAWLEKYPQYHQPEFSISYYNKGQILGVLLDILIRDATDNRASLDDVLRYLNRGFAHRGRFYDEGRDLRAAVEQVAGRDFGDFFARYVAGTDPLPYGDILGLAGLELTLRGRDNTIEEMKNVTEKQRRIRESLLRGTTD